MKNKFIKSLAIAISILLVSNLNINAIDRQDNNENLRINLEEKQDNKNLEKISITRIEGKYRYETAIKSKLYLEDTNKTQSRHIVTASRESFSDALIEGLLASEYKCSILLVLNL